MSPAYSKYEDYNYNPYAPPSSYYWTPPYVDHGPAYRPDHSYYRPEASERFWNLKPPRAAQWIPDDPYYAYYSPRPSFYYQPAASSKYSLYPPPRAEYYSALPPPHVFRPFHPGDEFRHPDDYHVRPGFPSPQQPQYQQQSPVNQHCCRCPNHVCHVSSPPQPEDEKKIAVVENGPRITNEKEQKSDSDNKSQDISPAFWVVPWDFDKQRSTPVEQEKPVNRIPFTLFNGRSPSESEESPKSRSLPEKQQKQVKDENPIYWVPVQWLNVQNGETMKWVPRNPGLKSSSDGSSKAESFPRIYLVPSNFVFKDDGNAEDQQQSGPAKAKIGNIDQEDSNKGVQEGKIKEETKQKEKTSHKLNGVKTRDIPVVQVQEEKTLPKASQESSGTTSPVESKKTSSPRASKLPPVCLRVDPLPGKKKSANGNGKSRSPSPPRKEDGETAQKDSQSDTGKGNKVKDIKISSDKSEEKSYKSDKDAIEGKKRSNESMEDLKIDVSKTTAEASDETAKAARLETQAKEKGLSEEEAAVLIQAHYRAYLVRRFQPLKKLREIMKIKSRIDILEQQMCSPSFKRELVQNHKTKAGFNETLMNLLLQLDTVQGLLPEVREVRKSVAREITRLQENFDLLIEQAPSKQLEEDFKEQREIASTSEKIGETIACAAEKIEESESLGSHQNVPEPEAIASQAPAANGVEVRQGGEEKAPADSKAALPEEDPTGNTSDERSFALHEQATETSQDELPYGENGVKEAKEDGFDIDSKTKDYTETNSEESKNKADDEADVNVKNWQAFHENVKEVESEAPVPLEVSTQDSHEPEVTEESEYLRETQKANDVSDVINGALPVLFSSENESGEEEKATEIIFCEPLPEVESAETQNPVGLMMQEPAKSDEPSEVKEGVPSVEKEVEESICLEQVMEAEPVAPAVKTVPFPSAPELVDDEAKSGTINIDEDKSSLRQSQPSLSVDEQKNHPSEQCPNAEVVAAVPMEKIGGDLAAGFEDKQPEGEAKGRDFEVEREEEAEMLKRMVEELLQAGKKRTSTILQLREKIRQLEGRLNEQKSRMRRKHKSPGALKRKNGLRLKGIRKSRVCA
eukprot:TRINITY_DN3499_c0_g1_i1.p1 TRINITY_DN3499_c0_g1~~TRINITY_DN3499_c0_g1_i1.p1  ORF type:complete len:1086 (-),score=234.96 TRINITY_DN3499_c0_g1_i1:165-3422(-)